MSLSNRWFKAICSFVVFVFIFTCFGGIVGNGRILTAFAQTANGEREETADEEASKRERTENFMSEYRAGEKNRTLDKVTYEMFDDIYSLYRHDEDIDISAYTEIKDNPDGSHTADLYFEPVKFKTNEGKYEYIDLSLEKTGEAFKTAASPVESVFSSNASDSAVRLAKGDVEIAFRPTPKEEIQSKSQRIDLKTSVVTAKDNDADTIKYENILNGGQDISLTPTANGVKEDIILSALPKETYFSFDFNLKGIYPLLLEDGNV